MEKIDSSGRPYYPVGLIRSEEEEEFSFALPVNIVD